MSKVKNEQYIVLQGWMIKELQLKGNELMVYAIIYGFSQVDGQTYNGSLGYLADWLNATKRTIITTLQSLDEKGLLEKRTKIINGVKFCEYKAVTDFPSGEKISLGEVKKFHWGGEKISPNNIDNKIDNNIDNNTMLVKADLEKILVAWNDIKGIQCIKAITEKRRAKIQARVNSLKIGKDEILKAISNVSKSDFLLGTNTRGWKADFDWLFSDDTRFLKVLEGKYNGGNRADSKEVEGESINWGAFGG